FQRAALELLEEGSGPLSADARAIIAEVFLQGRKLDRTAVTTPEPDEWIAVETLFTALRRPDRATLLSRLWPAATDGSIRDRFRDRELRRLLFATMARKGHPIIDLFVV